MFKTILNQVTIYNISLSIIVSYVTINYPLPIAIILVGGGSVLWYYPLDNPPYSQMMNLPDKNKDDIDQSDQIQLVGNVNIDNRDLTVLATDPHFEQWFMRFSKNIINSSFGESTIQCDKIQVTDIDMFGSRFGFGKFKVNTTPTIPGIVFHRSPSVCVLFLIKCEDCYYGLLTLQARVPAGYLYLPELVAGMMDDNTGECNLIAAKEIEEETSIKIEPSKLIYLGDPDDFIQGTSEYICKSNESRKSAWDWVRRVDPIKSHRGYFNSPGGSTETTTFYMYEHHVTKNELNEMIIRFEREEHGIKSEGERIKLMLVPIQHMLDIAPDMKVGHALALRDRYIHRQYSTHHRCSDLVCKYNKEVILKKMRGEMQIALDNNSYKKVGELADRIFEYRTEVDNTKLCDICVIKKRC